MAKRKKERKPITAAGQVGIGAGIGTAGFLASVGEGRIGRNKKTGGIGLTGRVGKSRAASALRLGARVAGFAGLGLAVHAGTKKDSFASGAGTVIGHEFARGAGAFGGAALTAGALLGASKLGVKMRNRRMARPKRPRKAASRSAGSSAPGKTRFVRIRGRIVPIRQK